MENDLKAFIGLHRALAYLDKEVAKVHMDFGLTTGQFAVLEVLYHKGDLCVGEVKEKILSSTGTMPVIIKNLEKRGLITRLVDQKDKRRAILSLTEEGRDLIGQAYPVNEAKIRDLLRVLSKDDLENLLAITKKLGQR